MGPPTRARDGGERRDHGSGPGHAAQLLRGRGGARLPALQGNGLGSRLLTELLREAPTRWALLSTPEVAGEANNAFGLYRKFGFTDVARNFYYEGDKRPFAILALELPNRTE